MIVDEITKDSLRHYLNECSRYVKIDIERAYNVTIAFRKFHNGIGVSDHEYAEMLDLQKKWYNSLETEIPDYSVYSDPFYFCELWLCWVNYSRRYLKDISANKSFFGKSIVSDIKANTIIDLGCGFGYTTTALKELFSNSKVFGTNIEGSSQYDMAKNLGNQHDFTIIGSYENTPCDLIFASEYFEHFERPIEHLIQVIEHCNPKYMLIANAFTSMAIGHFNKYKNLSETYSGKDMSLLFNNTMRKYGYEKVKTTCWNNRPAYWRRNDSDLSIFFNDL